MVVGAMVVVVGPGCVWRGGVVFYQKYWQVWHGDGRDLNQKQLAVQSNGRLVHIVKCEAEEDRLNYGAAELTGRLKKGGIGKDEAREVMEAVLRGIKERKWGTQNYVKAGLVGWLMKVGEYQGEELDEIYRGLCGGDVRIRMGRVREGHGTAHAKMDVLETLHYSNLGMTGYFHLKDVLIDGLPLEYAKYLMIPGSGDRVSMAHEWVAGKRKFEFVYERGLMRGVRTDSGNRMMWPGKEKMLWYEEGKVVVWNYVFNEKTKAADLVELVKDEGVDVKRVRELVSVNRVRVRRRNGKRWLQVEAKYRKELEEGFDVPVCLGMRAKVGNGGEGEWVYMTSDNRLTGTEGDNDKEYGFECEVGEGWDGEKVDLMFFGDVEYAMKKTAQNRIWAGEFKMKDVEVERLDVMDVLKEGE